MKKVKLFLTRILILYVILLIILSSFSSSFARSYDASCGEYVSQYARDFIATYCVPESRTHYDCSTLYPHWSGRSEFSGDFYACCSTGVYYMYKLALGVDLYTLDFHGMCSDALNAMSTSSNWINVTNQTLQPGDIVIHPGHTEMYIGNNENANFGNSPHSGKISHGPDLNDGSRGDATFTHAFRLASSVDVDPSGKVKGGAANINYSKFFFNGVPDGQYSIATRSIWEVIIDAISQILDYLLGLLLYIIRAVIVGYTAIMENLLNWIVNSVADTGVESTELNMSSTETATSDYEQKVTVDTLLFNKLELFDINIFKVR